MREQKTSRDVAESFTGQGSGEVDVLRLPALLLPSGPARSLNNRDAIPTVCGGTPIGFTHRMVEPW